MENLAVVLIIVAILILVIWSWKKCIVSQVKSFEAHQAWIPNKDEEVKSVLIEDMKSKYPWFPSFIPQGWYCLYEEIGDKETVYYFFHQLQWIEIEKIRRIFSPHLKVVIVRRDGIIPGICRVGSEELDDIISNPNDYYLFGIVTSEYTLSLP